MTDERGASFLMSMGDGPDGPDVEQLLADISEPLMKYFLRRVQVREDAGDCVAETMLVVWRRRDDLPADTAEWKPWCFGVARRVLSTHHRGHARRIAIAERLRQTLRDDDVSSDPSDRDAELARALRSLKDIDRELIGLVAWEGFTIAEAGTIVGLRPDAARARYARARARLRRLLSA